MNYRHFSRWKYVIRKIEGQITVKNLASSVGEREYFALS